jgi:hypothetical protein
MTRIRRSSLVLAILVICVLATAGCRRRRSSNSTTIVNGADIFTTDTFPGAPVQTHNVADDLRGWSPSGLDVAIGSLRVTPNGDRGTMMATYQANSNTGTTVLFFGQYYDGSVWTPPVALYAPDMNSDTVIANRTLHAWINTDDHDSEDARARDGDCLILFLASDVVTTGVAGDGVNVNVYCTYFRSDDSAEISLRHGFQEYASRLSSQDGLGEDVRTLGVASDGLCGEAHFTGNNLPNYRWGDQTTTIVVTWQQREDNDAIAGFDDRALYSRQFQLDAAVSDDIPLLPAAGIAAETRVAISTLGASDSGTSSEETQVDEDFVSYNATMFFRLAANNTTGGDDNPSAMLSEVLGFDNVLEFPMSTDGVIESVTFDLVTGAPSSAVVLHGGTALATDALFNNGGFFLSSPGASFFPITGGCYGPDEGLANIVAFNIEFVNDGDGLQDAANSTRIGLSEIDATTGGLLTHAFVDAEAAAITDIIRHDDGQQSRISRNGDYVMIQWFEDEGVGISADKAVRVALYVTTRPDEDGSFTLLTLGDSLTLPLTVNADIDGVDLVNCTFQDQLGYICGIQSDPDVMNVIYQHSDGTGDTLFVARLTADIVPPASLLSVATILESQNDGTWGAVGFNTNHAGWGITDSGEGGNIIAFYIRDIDPSGTVDFRLFSEMTGVGGGTAQIDSVDSARQCFNFQPLTIIATPPGRHIGTFDVVDLEEDGDRAHGAERIHVIFREHRATEDSGTGQAVRTRVWKTEGRDDNPFADNFEPSAGTEFEPPFAIDLPNVDAIDAEDAVVIGRGVRDNTVGIFFLELGHLYYQEYNDSGDLGWQNVDGVSNPFLIDDDGSNESNSGESVGFFALFVNPTCSCDTLTKASLWWTKTADDFSSAERFQTRTRD